MAFKSNNKQGFSLVELSIVLVILGLLVGGVLSGQSLIRAAELRSVNMQFQQFQSAANLFQEKYFALPGDMPKATDFWGEVSSSDCVNTASTDKRTCNGNGDGIVVQSSTGSNESFRFWQHLANAGLIEGAYTGVVPASASADRATRDNAPSGKIAESLWAIYSIGTISGNSDYFNGTYNNFIEFGKMTATNDPSGPLLKPEETWNIDKKVDDGKPGSGKLVIRHWNVDSPSAGQGCTLATAASQLNADYNLAGTSKSCVILMMP